MPATWAELRGCLAALLDHFEYNTPAIRDADRVMSEADRWQELAVDLPPLPPEDAERTELLGLLRRLGPALADLDAPLLQLLHGPADLLNSTGTDLASTFQIFLAAFTSVRAALVVAQHAGATADDLLQLGRCTRLLLGTGRLVAAWAAEVVQLSISPVHVRSLFSHVIDGQLYVLTALISELSKGELVHALAAEVVPPQALLAWLRAVVAVQQSISLSPCEQYPGIGLGIGLLTECLCLREGLEPHCEALAADAALCSSLVGTLLCSLGKAAVALRLPPDRRPAHIAWNPVQGLAKVLVSQTLRPALDQHLLRADGRALLRLVQQAAVVLQHLPSAPPEGCSLSSHAHAHTASISLLSVLVTEVRKRAEPVLTQAVQPLVPALPQLATALQLAGAIGDGRLATMLCGCWTSVLTVMPEAMLRRGSATPTPEQLLAAATAMLRALPMAATCAQQLAQPAAGQAAAQAEEQQSVITIGLVLVGMLKAILLQLQTGDCNPSLMAAAQETHEACCRAIHWAAASPGALLFFPQGEPSRRALEGAPLKHLLGMLGLAGNVVAKAHHGHAGELAALSRAVRGTCAAHWAAVQAAMAAGSTSLDHVELATLTASLSFCAKAGPRAVGSSTELLALTDQLLRSLPAGLPDEEPDWLQGTALADVESAPRLAAHLVAGGTLEVAASGLPRRPGPHRASPLQAFLVSAAVEALKEVQHAGATVLGTSDASSDLAQAVQKLSGSLGQLQAAVAAWSGGNRQPECLRPALQRALLPAAQVAAALQAHWQRADVEPEQHQAAQLELAQAAATRASCAHLACPNVGATGRRGKLCTGCRVARFCCRACSVADWRAGHRAACRLLAAGREARAPTEAAKAE